MNNKLLSVNRSIFLNTGKILNMFNISEICKVSVKKVLPTREVVVQLKFAQSTTTTKGQRLTERTTTLQFQLLLFYS
jgi:hypothetical protein